MALGALVVLGCGMIAGCGSGMPGAPVPSASHGSASHGSASHGSASHGSASHGGTCAGSARLAAGVSVAAWRLGAIRFASPRYGVALTAPEIPCLRSLGNMGTEVSSVAQPVRLAVTEDGGRHWVTRGSVLPVTAGQAAGEQVAAVLGPDSWVVSGGADELLATRDYGATWAVQPVAAPVVAAASAGGWLWALSCPPVSPARCRPVVERMRLPDGTWVRTPLVAAATAQDPWLAVLSGDAAVIGIATPHPALASTTDGGALWSVRPPNTLSLSIDGGTRWTRAGSNPGGYFGQFDVLSGTAAWMLAPGAGLWQTTDGITWHAIGGASPAAR